MPAKKSAKSRKAKRPSKSWKVKQPKKLTGLEASLLSFRARNKGAPSELGDFKEQVSSHVRRLVFSSQKGKTARKTFDAIRRVADEHKKTISNG